MIDRLPWLYDRESVRGWWLMKAVGALIVGVLFLIWMIVQGLKPVDHLVKTGVQVEGRIQEMGLRSDGTPAISYTFYADGGNYGAERRTVADLNGLEPKGTITVWYDPKHPYDCITANELRGREGGVPMGRITVLLCVLGGLLVFIIVLLSGSKKKALCD